MVDKVVADFGKLNILVANAGIADIEVSNGHNIRREGKL